MANTIIIYHTDTPQDTAFRDKLYDAAHERVELAGMTQGEFEVIDILTEEEQRTTGHTYGPMRFKFYFSQTANRCTIYPAQYNSINQAAKVCREHGKCESHRPWQLAQS